MSRIAEIQILTKSILLKLSKGNALLTDEVINSGEKIKAYEKEHMYLIKTKDWSKKELLEYKERIEAELEALVSSQNRYYDDPEPATLKGLVKGVVEYGHHIKEKWEELCRVDRTLKLMEL